MFTITITSRRANPFPRPADFTVAALSLASPDVAVLFDDSYNALPMRSRSRSECVDRKTSSRKLGRNSQGSSW